MKQICNHTEYFNIYSSKVCSLIKNIDLDDVNRINDCFFNSRKNGRTIFFAGNGGSAATASHFVQDLSDVGRKANVKGFKTFCLTDNLSLLTTVFNDYGYEKTFSIQLSELFNEGDVLVVISASGNSPNVIEDVKQAKEMGGITIGLLGFDGGGLLKMCDYVIHTKTDKGEYGPVGGIHMILNHMITSFMVFKLMNEKKKAV